jgi:hypothetical protein
LEGNSQIDANMEDSKEMIHVSALFSPCNLIFTQNSSSSFVKDEECTVHEDHVTNDSNEWKNTKFIGNEKSHIRSIGKRDSIYERTMIWKVVI